MERKLINYLPYVVREFAEFQGITTGEQPEFELAWDSTQEVFDNQFIDTALDYGLKRWEKMLGIFPKGTDTLETRRARIKTKLNNFAPYSFRVLVQMLTAIADGSPFEVTLDPGTYLLKITAHWGDEGKIESLAYLIKYIVPCNIAVDSINCLVCNADGIIPFSGGMYAIATFFDTNDSIERHESAGTVIHRGGVSDSATVFLTNDFNENRHINGIAASKGKPVTAEIIEIKSNEGRFDNG